MEQTVIPNGDVSGSMLKSQIIPSSRHHATPSPIWDTELFILRGQERDDLRRQAHELRTYLENHREAILKDLAFTLNTDLQPGGCRLAVVADSVAALETRLASAVDRLADPKRTQIKDALGIYWFDEPLGPQGGLALLFPGEGAQYLNMLSDLCPHFPEVKQCFDDCDRMAAQGTKPGRPLFSRVFLVPDDARPEEKAEAEKALRELDHAMFSVLLADWAMYQLLSHLGLKPAAVAGHSMGELAALSAAGCLERSIFPLDSVVAAMNSLLAKENASDMATVLLAVGAGKDVVGEIIHGKESAGVFLAMDNCPHQSVLVGPPGPMAAVEAELQARRILCERLPFNRPYHTPLFEPFLGPLHELFATIPFSAARTPIYSCSTSRLFPSEPAEIRRLTVGHYATPVEFTRLIDNMYADGVRLFVESGPRGNLTSFVEDILRGRSFAAIAANVPRRSGPTQLNHLAGQLAAHHVPLNLDHLYRRRHPQRIAWETGSPSVSLQNSRSEVVSQYLGVMEQFLDLQHDMMHAFLACRNQGTGVGTMTAEAVPASSPNAAASLPLLRTAQILRLEPGQEVVLHRRLDLAEDLFVMHHTVGGRSASKVDPNQHGLPVLPMTFTLEIMAETASLLAPGQVIVGSKGIRLYRWLAYDEEEPTTIEVKARVLAEAATEPGVAMQVAVEIRDLGNSSNSAHARWTAAQGTVLLCPRYPEPPAVGEFPLTNEHPCRIPLDVLYKNLFHGPLFQGVSPGGRAGDEGIEKEVVVLPREHLFCSHRDPNFLLDPVLLDVAMHPLASWHLEAPDQSGRILLPIELEKIEMFGPRPEVGTRFLSRGLILATHARHFIHQVDVIGPEQRLWCRFSKLKYWRFYVPFAKVNFHGPKDEYFISKPWKAALPESPVPACCIRLDMPLDQKQAAMRLVTARVTLSPGEWQEFRGLGGNEDRQNEWLFSRLAAKDAVRTLWYERHGERLFPADIVIQSDARGRPVAVPRGPAGAEPFPTIAIAHSEDVAVGVAAYCPQAGTALERVLPREAGFEDLAFDDQERQLLDRFGDNRDEGIARFLSARKAIAGAMGSIVDESKSLAVREVNPHNGYVTVFPGPEVHSPPLIARTVRDNDLVVAITFCEKAGGMSPRTQEQIMMDLRNILRDFNGKEYSGDIGPETLFFADLGLASIDAVILGETLERFYQRSFPLAEILAAAAQEGIQDIALGELAGFLNRELNRQGD